MVRHGCPPALRGADLRVDHPAATSRTSGDHAEPPDEPAQVVGADAALAREGVEVGRDRQRCEGRRRAHAGVEVGGPGTCLGPGPSAASPRLFPRRPLLEQPPSGRRGWARRGRRAARGRGAGHPRRDARRRTPRTTCNLVLAVRWLPRPPSDARGAAPRPQRLRPVSAATAAMSACADRGTGWLGMVHSPKMTTSPSSSGPRGPRASRRGRAPPRSRASQIRTGVR